MRKGQKHSKKTIKLLSKSHKGIKTWNTGTGEKKNYICKICKKNFYDYICKKRKFCGIECKNKYIGIIMKGHPVSEEARRNIGIKNSVKLKGRLISNGLDNWRKNGGKVWNKDKEWLEMRGENSPVYIKDRTKLKKSEKKHLDSAYINWMLEVKKRDGWKCRLLNSDCKGRLESHHIFNWIDYPELRYILTNGITLCAFHHPRGREEEKRMIPILQELLSVSKE